MLPSYGQAIFAFDFEQFCLLAMIAFLIWKIIDPKNLSQGLLTFAVLGVTIAEPWPWPSLDYYLQWFQGESKVLQLTLILLAIYLVKNQKLSSGIFVLALSSFDPRFTLEALPLFLYFYLKNQNDRLKSFAVGVALVSVMLLVPFMLYGNLLVTYLTFKQYDILVFYPYEWIAFFSVLSLSVAVALSKTVPILRTKDLNVAISSSLRSKIEGINGT